MPSRVLASFVVAVVAACASVRVPPSERVVSLEVAGFVQAEGIT